MLSGGIPKENKCITCVAKININTLQPETLAENSRRHRPGKNPNKEARGWAVHSHVFSRTQACCEPEQKGRWNDLALLGTPSISKLLIEPVLLPNSLCKNKQDREDAAISSYKGALQPHTAEHTKAPQEDLIHLITKLGFRHSPSDFGSTILYANLKPFVPFLP